LINQKDKLREMTDQKVFINKHNYEHVLNQFKRNNYLSDEDRHITRNIISEGLSLPVMFNDVKESIMFKDYELIVHGITACGSKTTILIKGINPTVDILVDGSLSKAENAAIVKSYLRDSSLAKKLRQAPSVSKLELVYGKPLVGFSEQDSTFVRVYFRNIWHRKEFINMLTRRGVQTFNNDLSSYYRVAARQYKLQLTGWSELTDYTCIKTKEYKSEYVIEVNVTNIEKLESRHGYDPMLFKKDKMISMSFDIEQFSSSFDINKPNRETHIPRGDILEDTIFNIGMTFHFVNEPDKFLGLSFMTEDCEPNEGYVTVVCDSEKTILLAFAYMVNVVQPDYIYEFNGSGFDWPNIYAKAGIYKCLDKMLDYMSIKTVTKHELESKDRYIYVADRIKISADTTDQKMANIRLHGYLAFDLRISLMQLNPTKSKSSLKFYLELYNLESKDDMPIPTLFGYFATKDYKGLGDVAKYCYVDCLRLHQLIYKINLIQDRRAVGLLSYTSLFDAFYRANSSKVRNLIVAHALDKKLFYNSIKKEVDESEKMEGKYPGALVLNPKVGLVSPLLSFEEYCKKVLQIEDHNVITEAKKIVDSEINKRFY
jgi:hypothetical protein